MIHQDSGSQAGAPARSLFHSVTLDRDLCRGCINCIKRCPTEAIRVREGKASIISEKCIDCGECIRICPHHAKQPLYDPLEAMARYRYTVALPAPSLYGQFNNLEDLDILLQGLLDMGFDDVYEVSRAAELVSEETRRLLAQGSLPQPVISSACPVVVRLVQTRFPALLDHLLPVVPPVELAAREAKAAACAKTGLPWEEIGAVFISPCPAKVTAARRPLGVEKSEVDLVVAMKDVYPRLLAVMNHQPASHLQHSGRIGIGWAESGGEAAGLISTDNFLAADGIENVIRVLSELEDNKFHGLAFVELNACAGGCVGGVLAVENPYIAKSKIQRLRRYMPVAQNHLEGRLDETLQWQRPLPYDPVLELGDTRMESFARAGQLEEIVLELPGLDCGSCGAPTCRALAEDIVRGNAAIQDCVVLMRQNVEKALLALGAKPKGDGGHEGI